jgi:hypothetical protein
MSEAENVVRAREVGTCAILACYEQCLTML